MSISNQNNQFGVREVLIGTSTVASGDATMDILLPQEFASFRIEVNALAPATDNVALFARTRTLDSSAFDSGASDYAWGYNSVLAGTGLVTASDDADSEIQLALAVGNAANEAASGVLWVLNNAEQSGGAAYPQVMFQLNAVDATPAYVFYHGGGTRLSAEKIDGLQLLFASGNLSAGSVNVYGYFYG